MGGRTNSALRATLVAGVAVLWLGCNNASGHRVLSIFFDGVPPPRPAAVTAVPGDDVARTDLAAQRVGPVEHEPYAERQCDACHDAKATNALVVPREQLCFQCHDFDLSAKFVHGPLVAGGCLLCHDPHSSPYRHLLRSDSDGFCLSCHDRRDLTKIDGHEAGRVDCTSCHQAHTSDKKYLLK